MDGEISQGGETPGSWPPLCSLFIRRMEERYPMMKILKIALLGSVLSLAASKSLPGESTRFNALFCPECWTYLWGGGTLDMKGNCAECGKYPVELEGRSMSWWWCASSRNGTQPRANRMPGSTAATRKNPLP